MKEQIKFESLTDFYNKIEAVDDYRDTSTANRINELIKDSNHHLNESDRKKLVNEMEAFSFRISGGKVHGYIKSIGEDGITIYEYPDAKMMTTDTLSYYYDRSNETKNCSVKLRYLQILVSSENKNYIVLCMKKLIDTYLQIIEEQRNSALISKKYGALSSLINGAFSLAKKAKYKTQEISAVCLKLFLHKFPGEANYKLFDHIVVSRKYYSKDELSKVYEHAIVLSATPPYCDNCFAMEKLTEPAIKLVQVIKSPQNEWNEKLAVTYELEMFRRSKDDTSMMMLMHWCEKSIEQYQLAGNYQKVQELYIKYSELRKNFKLASIEVELDRNELKKWYNFLDNRAKYLILHNNSDTIFEYLSDGNDIFPDAARLNEGAKSMREPFLSSISIGKADINKKFSKIVVT